MDMLVNILLLIMAGAFAIGSSIIIHQDAKYRDGMRREYMDKLPKKREDGFPWQKKPLTGEGQFDKQRTTYTDGDNT